MNFSGFCSYPLGGSTTGTLILSTSAALAATMYATISCRFVVVTFTSNAGGFEDFFNTGSHRNQFGDVSGSISSMAQEESDSTTADFVSYKAAVGLYQWLKPTDAYDWSQGSCFGYQESMLASITDPYFDMSRSFAVFAVLLAVFQALWMFLTACLSLNRIQCFLLCFLSFAGTVSTGLTFLFTQSALCQSAFSTRDCAMDEGGLVMMTACVLWLITFCIAICFVVPTVVLATSSPVDPTYRAKGGQATATGGTPSGGQTKVQRYRKASTPATTATAIGAPLPIQQSFSYDSQSSWTNRIPKRPVPRDVSDGDDADADDTAPPVSSSDRRGGRGTTHKSSIPSVSSSRPNQPSVDANDAMRVYITKRLDRIEELADV